MYIYIYSNSNYIQDESLVIVHRKNDDAFEVKLNGATPFPKKPSRL